MFSKAKKNKPVQGDHSDSQPTSEPQTKQSNQPTASQNKAQAKRASNMKSPGVPSIISTDVVLEGNLISTGEVQFDGALTGNIKAASLIIGEKASVTGEVACEAVTIRGRVEGMVRARNVALAATAHIQGDIMHSSLSVEPGAHFDGNCRHSDDPLADDAAKAFDRPTGNAPTQGSPRPTPSANLDTTKNSFAIPSANTHETQIAQANNFNELGAQPSSAQSASQQNGNQQGASSFLAKNRSPLR